MLLLLIFGFENYTVSGVVTFWGFNVSRIVPDGRKWFNVS